MEKSPGETRRLGSVDVSPAEQERYARCFACGPENPVGLDLHVTVEGDAAWADFVPTEAHEGWPGFLHGGIAATLLDEVMSYLAYGRGERAMTVRLHIRYRSPAPTGQALHTRAEVVKATRRTLQARGTVLRADGETVAEADGTLYVLSPLQRQQFGLI